MLGPNRASLHRALERERARNQQRETELINQILYLSGRMWTPPPADMGDEDMDDLAGGHAMVSALQLPLVDEEEE